MTDQIDIQQTLNKWSEGASRLDWEQIRSTLMPDAIWEFKAFSLQAKGVEDVVSNLMAFTAPLAYSVQLNAPAVIIINGKEATARTVIREHGRRLDSPDEAFEGLGFYNDVLVRDDDQGWKFSSRTFDLVAVRNFALLPEKPPPA